MSDKYIIGIDPDSKAHGVASYDCGELLSLKSMTLLQLQEKLLALKKLPGFDEVEIHMENVCANNAVFRGGHSVKVQQSLARRLGICQQSQVEIERLAESMGVPVVHHKISKKWKDQSGKAEFERLTGWTGRSNEDTRSAAYFGFLGCK